MDDETKDFASEAEWLITQIGSLHRIVPIFTVAVYEMRKTVHDRLMNFIDQRTNVTSDDGKQKTYIVPPEAINKHRRLKRLEEDTDIFTNLLPRMAVVSLVSVYDAYLGRLVRAMYAVQPELLNNSERKITYDQLTKFGSLEDAREHILLQEIEALLRKSHDDQFAWLESKLKIPLRKGLPTWATFVELTERRNLFVHADGVVSDQYMQVCKRAGSTLDPDCSVGSTLEVTPGYFENACQCVLEIGVKLNQVMWRKLLPDDSEQADHSLSETAYELLVQKEYRLAENLLRFGTEEESFRHPTKDAELRMKMNLAIAIKGQKRNEDCAKFLDNIDLSASADQFKLAAAALREDLDQCVSIMRRIGSEGSVGKEEYINWPLFNWVRGADKFKQTYQEIFGEPLEQRASENETLEDEHEEPRDTDNGDPTREA